MFHPPRRPNEHVTGHGYISNDGHMFDCRNPVTLQQAFHVYVSRVVLAIESANILIPVGYS